jgi:hypothetical protein
VKNAPIAEITNDEDPTATTWVHGGKAFVGDYRTSEDWFTLEPSTATRCAFRNRT